MFYPCQKIKKILFTQLSQRCRHGNRTSISIWKIYPLYHWRLFLDRNLKVWQNCQKYFRKRSSFWSLLWSVANEKNFFWKWPWTIVGFFMKLTNWTVGNSYKTSPMLAFNSYRRFVTGMLLAGDFKNIFLNSNVIKIHDALEGFLKWFMPHSNVIMHSFQKEVRKTKFFRNRTRVTFVDFRCHFIV